MTEPKAAPTPLDAKFARKVRGGPYMYKGREIVPGRKPRKEIPKAQQLEVPQ